MPFYSLPKYCSSQSCVKTDVKPCVDVRGCPKMKEYPRERSAYVSELPCFVISFKNILYY